MKPDNEKLANRALLLLIAYMAVSGACRASLKPFWCDEVITVGLARLPSLASIREALAHAADSHPPTFYFVMRLAGRLPLNELIAFRIPSILAFCCVILCIFLFIKKRRGSTCALLCATIPLLSLLYSLYAVEARGYSLMAGFVAVALVCYQRADKTAGWIVMGLSLAAAEASHYYAVFAFVPFGLAELVLLVKEHRVRFGVWLALLFGVLPLGLFWPLLHAFKMYYGAHFGGYPSLDEAARAYGWLFNLPPAVGIGLALIALAAITTSGYWDRHPPMVVSQERIPLQEHVLAIGFLMLPLLMHLSIRALHGGFSSRYFLLTILGFPLACSYIVVSLDRRLLALFSILLLATLGAQEAVFWRWQFHSLGQKISSTEGVERLVRAAGHGDLPVVDSDALDYLWLTYYASPEVNRRLVFLADVPAAIVYAGSDSADKCLLALRPYLPIRVQRFSDFAGNHEEFLLYSDGRPKWDWWPNRLLHDGYALQVVAIDQERRLYLVHKHAETNSP